MNEHRLEFEQDFLAHLHDAMTPCCSCGWRGDCCNNQDDARIAWENHVEASTWNCTAKIRPFPNDTEIRCERKDPPHDRHESVIRDYAYPGSETKLTWDEWDQRNFHGEWSRCPWPTGCILPGTHIGSHAQ